MLVGEGGSVGYSGNSSRSSSSKSSSSRGSSSSKSNTKSRVVVAVVEPVGIIKRVSIVIFGKTIKKAVLTKNYKWSVQKIP